MKRDIPRRIIQEAAKDVDPVCGRAVDRLRSKWRAGYDSDERWFCSATCLRRFLADPERYAQEPERHERE